MAVWRMEYDNDMHGNHWWQIDTTDCSRSIADVYEEEDARLIVAAPEMAVNIERLEAENARLLEINGELLEACKCIVSEFRSLGYYSGEEVYAIEQAKAAIAKAEAAL